MKLVIIVGTRPEIIRLAPTINKCRKYFNVELIHTGQNYDYNLNQKFFEDLNIAAPEHYLNCSRDNLGQAVGDIISKSYNLLKDINPDAILILGDTNSCLSAYSAKRLKIPIFHIEAGNRCFDQNLPEETNRKIIDHISDINMCYMEHARRNLLAEGITPQYVFVIGSPIPEVYETIKNQISDSNILNQHGLTKDEYFVWSSHREENIDIAENFNHVVTSINALATKYDKKILFTVHPRTRNKINKLHVSFHQNVILSEPLGLIDYYKLQQNALCVISDSGTVTEEANILGFKAVLLRTSTEHPEGIDNGSIIVGNNNWEYLENCINLVLTSQANNNNITAYQDLNFSEKVCNIIAGYTSIVNKFIWMK